jgi:hypothetical protein
MTLFDYFRWCQNFGPIVAMRASPWFFPVVASIHLMGLAMVGGSVLMVDLRLLGLGFRGQPLAQVSRDAERWLLCSLLVVVPTGVLQFMCFAVKYYYLRAFWVKMTCLLTVLTFTFLVRRRVALADELRVSPVWAKLVAVISLSLWTSIAVAGRLIGFP